MFCTRYFADRYFAPRYYPKVGADPVAGGWGMFLSNNRNRLVRISP